MPEKYVLWKMDKKKKENRVPGLRLGNRFSLLRGYFDKFADELFGYTFVIIDYIHERNCNFSIIKNI